MKQKIILASGTGLHLLQAHLAEFLPARFSSPDSFFPEGVAFMSPATDRSTAQNSLMARADDVDFSGSYSRRGRQSAERHP